MRAMLSAALGVGVVAFVSTAHAGLEPGDYRISEIGVTVADSKSGGDDWDRGGGGPDLSLELQLDGNKIASCEKDDTITARCSIDGDSVSLGAGTTLRLVVRDRDLMSDDDVGSATLANPLSSASLGSEISLEPDGAVESAHLVLSEPPPPADSMAYWKPRLIGAGAGTAVALVLAFAFGGWLFRKIPGPGSGRIKVRCSRCKALNEESAPTCHNCRAEL